MVLRYIIITNNVTNKHTSLKPTAYMYVPPLIDIDR